MATKTQEEELKELNALFPNEKLPPRDELARRIQAQANDLCQNYKKVKGWYSSKSKTRNGRKLSECLNPARSLRPFFNNVENLVISLDGGPFNNTELELTQNAFSTVSQFLLTLDERLFTQIRYSIRSVATLWENISLMFLDYLFEPKSNRQEAIARYLHNIEQLRLAFSHLALDFEHEERKLTVGVKNGKKTPKIRQHDYLKLCNLYPDAGFQDRDLVGEKKDKKNNRVAQKQLTAFKKYIDCNRPRAGNKKKEEKFIKKLRDENAYFLAIHLILVSPKAKEGKLRLFDELNDAIEVRTIGTMNNTSISPLYANGNEEHNLCGRVFHDLRIKAARHFIKEYIGSAY